MCKFLKNRKYFPLLITFLMGIAIGFLISPVKKGISIFSYNGNNNGINGKFSKNLDELDE
ncbi:MAG: hypothetical protein LIO71_08125 [Ruminococcus sp.]|nr:hypothetical protein [Ruminococcus sp.]MCD7800948.1 hypothetical protein [Ruminococcus sp.]